MPTLIGPSVADLEDSIMQRQRSGSVVLDRRIQNLEFPVGEDGKRRSKKIGTVRDYPRKHTLGGQPTPSGRT